MFDLHEYQDTMRTLVASAKPTPELLEKLQAPDLFATAAHPKAALAGLWLYFDCFEASHVISQNDSSPEGNYWHAIAHRREPDYWNSGYWFRQVGKHAIHAELLEAVRALPYKNPPLKLGAKWDPAAFLELCEQADISHAVIPYALDVQRLEWKLLFDYCSRQA
jgi:hypothetical protein